MDKKVLAHFKASDPTLHQVIKKLGKFESLHKTRGVNYFEDLVGSITSQQLSTKAADTIFKRFKALLNNKIATPEAVLSLSDEKIRSAGMSYPKIKYIKDLAQKVQSGEIKLENLKDLPNEEVIGVLIKIKGIGKWTAEMFLIFSLKREDVFSHGDLGLQNAIKKIYKIENYSEKKVEKIISKWAPYKSYASLALWRSLDATKTDK